MSRFETKVRFDQRARGGRAIKNLSGRQEKYLVGLSDPSKPIVHKVGNHYRNFRLLNRNELAHHSQGQSPMLLACRVYFCHQPTRHSQSIKPWDPPQEGHCTCCKNS